MRASLIETKYNRNPPLAGSVNKGLRAWQRDHIVVQVTGDTRHALLVCYTVPAIFRLIFL